ncbi:MAG: hypothetical protein JSR77_08860 [Planctomycetes bacterium]|nr:hypothetical protein [Planctomycetota bacterium]
MQSGCASAVGYRLIAAVIAGCGAWTAEVAAGQGPDPEPAPVKSTAAPAATVAKIEPKSEQIADEKPSTPRVTNTVERKPLHVPATGAAAQKPAPTSSPVNGASLTSTTLALAAVLTLIFAVAAFIKRFAAKGALSGLGLAARAPSGVVHVLARYPVQKGLCLVLLKVDRRVLVLSQSSVRGGTPLATLAEITQPEEVASILAKCGESTGESLAAKFQATLSKADREIEAPEAPAPRKTRVQAPEPVVRSAMPRQPRPVRVEDAGAPEIQSPAAAAAESLRLKLAALRAATASNGTRSIAA